MSKINFRDIEECAAEDVLRSCYDLFSSRGYKPQLSREDFVNRIADKNSTTLSLDGLFDPWEYRETDEVMAIELLESLVDAYKRVGFVNTKLPNGDVEVFIVDQIGSRPFEGTYSPDMGPAFWVTIEEE